MTHLKTKGFLGDILGSQGDPALGGIGNAEHDAQLQLAHEVIAAVPLEDVLPCLGQAQVSLLLLHLSRPVFLDGLSVVILAGYAQDTLVRHHAMLIVPQEDDVGSVVVGTGWLVHLQAVRLYKPIAVLGPTMLVPEYTCPCPQADGSALQLDTVHAMWSMQQRNERLVGNSFDNSRTHFLCHKTKNLKQVIHSMLVGKLTPLQHSQCPKSCIHNKMQADSSYPFSVPLATLPSAKEA